MKLLKKSAVMLLGISLMAVGFSFISLAAAKKKISSVSLNVEANIKAGDMVGEEEILIDTPSDKYSISEYEVMNSGFEWGISDIPKVKVVLSAEENYYFTVSNAKDVKLTGAGTSCLSVSKRDASQTLEVTINLTPLAEYVGEIAEARWSDVGLAQWEEVYGAGEYEVKLYRDGKSLGTTKTTSSSSYDFSSSLTRSGSYSYKIRPINRIKPENKGSWVESPTYYIDNETASDFRTKYGKTTTGGEPGVTVSGGWIWDQTGWWYRNQDGSYPSNNWRVINDKWYYFKENGYMATGWVLWKDIWYYCDESGAMMSDATTPDGYRLGADGSLVY